MGAIFNSLPPNAPLVANTKNPLLGATFSQNPLDYVSPQAAIAAGLDAGAVKTAWAAQVNSFPSVQDAINAGIAPTVVTELWAGGNLPAPSWWDQLTMGIPNKLWVAGGVFGALAFFAAGKGSE